MMTSDFVLNIHLNTARNMLSAGASLEQLAEHLGRVGFSEREISQLLSQFASQAMPAEDPYLNQPQ